MKKIVFSLLVLFSAPTYAGTLNVFELKGPVTGVAGDYDESGVFVTTSVVIYINQGGTTESIRVFCPEAGGCGPVVSGNCLDLVGKLHPSYARADTVTFLPRADCF